ncbi:uncharacterized protein LOC141628486 [Silene latifolia]|uniref:uncharacterized protein LOC141628486 n=1 Tax=Silene latifolia TaxID=37657 RepID=UPI003D77E1D5
MIDDHYLTIRKWVPNFVPSEDSIKFLTAWVRIPNHPVEYFNEAFLKKVGAEIGEVVRIDKNTASVERGQFTRMSVEVDISKPLISKFRLNGKGNAEASIVNANSLEVGLGPEEKDDFGN